MWRAGSPPRGLDPSDPQEVASYLVEIHRKSRTDVEIAGDCVGVRRGLRLRRGFALRLSSHEHELFPAAMRPSGDDGEICQQRAYT